MLHVYVENPNYTQTQMEGLLGQNWKFVFGIFLFEKITQKKKMRKNFN